MKEGRKVPKGDEEMLTVVQFLGVAAGAVLLLLVLVYALEKAAQLMSGGRMHRCVRITVCLGAALLILCVPAYGLGQVVFTKAAFLGGLCILLNRYWLGHFSGNHHL